MIGDGDLGARVEDMAGAVRIFEECGVGVFDEV
jgi:hypothetical protein